MNHTLTLNSPILVLLNKEGLMIFKIVTFISIFCLLSLSILQIGFLTKEFYLIKNYERRLTELSKENKILEIDFSKMNSLANIENYLLNEKFVKINGIKYIQIMESSIATKPH